MKRILALGAIAAALAAAACDRQPAAPSAPGTDPLFAKLVAMGFNPIDIVDRGDRFVVEGDIGFLKSDLRTMPAAPQGARADRSPAPGGPRFAWRTTNVITTYGGAERTVYVFISSTIRTSYPTWAQAVRDAMGVWNRVGGSGLTFVETTTSSSAQITVSTYTAGGTVVAEAGFPANGNPGTYIHINTALQTSLNARQKLQNMVHEMGHTMGFRHSNWQALGEPSSPSGAVKVPLTPDSDLTSVMRGNSGSDEFYALGSYDPIAVRQLYMGGVQPVGSLSGGNIVIAWPSEAGAYQYRLYKDTGYPFTLTWDVATVTDTTWVSSGVTPTSVHNCGFSEFATEMYYVYADFGEGTTSRQSAQICVYY